MKFFLKFLFLVTFIISIFSFNGFSQPEEYLLNRLTVEQVGKTTYVTIGGTDIINYNDSLLEEPLRIVIDCQGAIDSLPAIEKSDLQGTGILSIRSYQYNKELGLPTPITRITIDLEEKTSYIIMGDEKNLILAIDAVGFQEGEGLKTPEEIKILEEETRIHEPPPASPEESTEPDLDEEEKEITTPTRTAPRKPPQTQIERDRPIPPAYEHGRDFIIVEEKEEEKSEKPEEVEKEVEMRKISFRLIDAEIRNILRLMADFAGVNIVAGSEIKGEVTVILNDVPWRQALNIILKTKNFGIIEEDYGILRVVTQSEVERAQREKYEAEKELERLAPLKTEVLKIKYATAQELLRVAQTVQDERGSVNVEDRTNSLIITGTANYIKKVKDLVSKLDTHTPQVVVQARVISITPSLTKDFGIQWGIGNPLNPTTDTHIDANVNPGALSTTGGTVAFGSLVSGFELETLFSAMESQGQGEVLSEPRITVLDNKSARIHAGMQRESTLQDEAGNTITQTQDIGVILEVSPHIVADDKILMDLSVEISSLPEVSTEQRVINKDDAETQIMVDNNATAVIGGLMRTDRTQTQTSVPILGKLPLFGKFFRKDTYSLQKRELMIFVTPTIVRPPNESDQTEKEEKASL